MAFQEPVDPLVEKLQNLIDDVKEEINYKGFEEILSKIDEEFPFVDLSEFLEMYVNGEYSKVLIEKFHLRGFQDYYRLLQILKLNKKRKAAIKNSISRKTNLTDKKFEKRYEFLQKVLQKFQKSIKIKINHNVLRAIIILKLFSDEENFVTKKEFIKTLPNAIQDFEHLILAPHIPLANIKNEEILESANYILNKLKDEQFIETNSSGDFRLEKHQLLLKDYIYNTIQNRENGITYQDLLASLKTKLRILTKIPSALVDITLHEFIISNKIIKKEGYWQFKPFFDQYFTFENYRKLNSEFGYSTRRNREFFGRKITPEQFISEIKELEKGNFEDLDDQVTRIAGMILTNSNIMTYPPNELQDFDFCVDLSRYEFTKEQQRLIDSLQLEIRSKKIYVKVIINEKVTAANFTELFQKLSNREKNEQGFIISFLKPDETVEKILRQNKTIQIISEKELKEWCKITPVIPSRRGAVAAIRQGDNKGSIVKIKSINYESGRADIVLLPDMNEGTSYIGALEEIPIPANIKKFTDYSNMYFQFLSKLRNISKTDIFRKIVSDSLFVSSLLKQAPNIRFLPENQIECIFGENFKTQINLESKIDSDSLLFTTTDLFSCTCFQWNEKSRRNGLCEHLIFTLNETIKKIFSLEGTISERKIQWQLKQIEKKMDLFLNRLRYCNFDGTTVAKCPNCGKSAYSIRGVEDTFGFRQMNRDDKFSLRRQSQCKFCRRH